MKSAKNKLILTFISSTILFSCTPNMPVNNQADFKSTTLSDKVEMGQVKLKFNFPEKLFPDISSFHTKAIEYGKINRIKVKIESMSTPYTIERTVELVPGGVEATIGLPLEKLYVITVLGLNDTTFVSGSEIMGYFSLMSASALPTVEVSQNTTPVAKIIKGVKAKIDAAIKDATAGGTVAITPTPVPTATTSTNTSPVPSGSAVPSDAPIPTPTPFSFPSPTLPDEFKIRNIDTVALDDIVKRARLGNHPSFVNVDTFINYIFDNKKVPIDVPENSMIKPGKVKGSISGLKYGEVAIISVGDPASKQTIVVTPPQIVSRSTDFNSIDPDKVAEAVDFVIDSVTPGSWPVSVLASGYSKGDTKADLTVASDQTASTSFSLTASSWIKAPLNISGNVGNSDQSNLALDPVDNIHMVWRQDGFNTDTNSGVIFYSRWNGTSWTTQGVNISQYNESSLKGSNNPSIAVGLDRLPHVVWSAKDSSNTRKIFYNFSNGTTWQNPMAISGSDGGITPSVTVDSTNGYLYAVWESSGSIMMSQYSKDTVWSAPIQIGSGFMPKIAMGSNGVAHIVWHSASGQKLQYASWSLKKALSPVEDIPMNTLGNDTDNTINIAIDRFNRLHLVWRNDIYIQYAIRSNVSWSQPEVVNQIDTTFATAKSGANISIAPTGVVNVAWVSINTDNKQVVRFRRRMSDGWKKPFTKIVDTTEPVKINDTTTTTTTKTEIKHSENIDGYEDIPLSHVTSVDGTPSIVADSLGRIHVMWSNMGDGSTDTDLLHSIKLTK